MPQNVNSRRLLVTGVTWAAALALAATGSLTAQAAPESEAPGHDASVAAAMQSMSVEEKVGQLFLSLIHI